MHRRQLLVAGGSLFALSACAANGMTMGGGTPAATLASDAAAARAVLPVQTPRAELLQVWTGPYEGVPPWDRVTADKLKTAILEGIELQRAEYAAIADNPEPPTFANTLVAGQMAGEPLGRALAMFGVMTGNIGSPDYQAVQREVAPILTQAGNEITFNERLFQRIKSVADNARAHGLTAEQTRLAERSRDSFVRNGAALDAAGKAELGRINTALSNAFTSFGQKVVADENAWTVIPTEAGVAGLPASNKAAAAAAARSRNVEGWAIVNTRSSVDPFLSFGDDRAMREVVWRKFVNRGDNGDANDTNATIAEIVRLRAERARLLGFANHAEWRMQDTMARTPAAAMDLMNRVWAPAKARVIEEVADMRAIAGHEIEPWDYLYYAEKVRKQKYDLDQNELKPYFELNNVKRGAFHMAGRLYGFDFTPVPAGSVPGFHPDVEVFEVTNKSDGSHVGLFYSDDFSRAGKRSGAWATTYRSYSTYDGVKNVLSSNNNNFTKAEGGEPILISLDDAQTLFHEFGHALHSLSAAYTYPALGGTPRDYVEYPSQVHEHWVLSRPILDGFMKHVETGQPMPQSLVDKIEASNTFNQGYDTVSYLSSALVDMDLHTRATPPTDIDAFERESLARYGMPKEIVMRHRLPQFNHLFTSDAYSAGYYSYLWSEVMDADTWAYFEESGDVFNPDIASRYKAIILAEGNTTDRAEAYRRFRGRDPDVTALLKVRGFPTS
ncbi:MAG: M3 family metallopeptidase [Alphaproteobacteria bacterium]|jgi:peptidyl-dipeptidase Dcp|nr:M3 family metallopeptidase [Alphaproteobacteria bacterium]MBU2043217.1 M3 family metallopeptidase [Alphaproteobacteria bacterium]MBU2124753.1 M3 family metallopeptidase [Alphaproteobacteria bacterium]MBU2208427.1 M3 family metallopeptidase [Alphaproteobacteria bacterium]MBU2290608.1 M3 family metallopeptidase [Alphaproteobacteria bacterium]